MRSVPQKSYDNVNDKRLCLLALYLLRISLFLALIYHFAPVIFNISKRKGPLSHAVPSISFRKFSTSC